MPHTATGLEYRTTTQEGRPQVFISTPDGGYIWVTKSDLTEMLRAIRRRKPKRKAT